MGGYYRKIESTPQIFGGGGGYMCNVLEWSLINQWSFPGNFTVSSLTVFKCSSLNRFSNRFGPNIGIEIG